jgi:hypothetical protein
MRGRLIIIHSLQGRERNDHIAMKRGQGNKPFGYEEEAQYEGRKDNPGEGRPTWRKEDNKGEGR